jgi:hypothetical protein
MRTKTVLVGMAILALGLAATLLSGLYQRNMTELLGMSKVGYGYPLVWYGYYQAVLYPSPPPFYWSDWRAFTLDVAFWSLAFALLFMTIYEVKKKYPRI